MPDVFISYSRKDAATAVLIAEQLLVSGFECWLDQGSIPPAEDWRDELELGIRQSDNFLFLISPNSLDSKVCMNERMTALSLKKRTIPVVAQHPREDQTIGDDLSRFQHIDATIGLSDAVFKQIHSAITRDLPWKRQSTEYLTRAQKWEEGKGGLLVPSELEPARNWLKQGAHISPGPTELQLRFVDESERTCTASRFAENADRLIEREPDRALLLAAEACFLIDAPWTKRVLAAVLDRHHALCLYLHEFCGDPATDISDLGFSRDGSNLAATGVFDALSPEPVETGLRCWNFPNISLRRQMLVRNGLGCFAWGRTADDIAVGAGSIVAVMGIGKGNLTGRKLDKHSQSVRCLAIDPTGSFLASGDEGGTTIIWKLENGEDMCHFDGLGVVQGLAWSEDCRWLIVSGQNRALLLESPDFINVREFPLDSIQAADISADGMLIAFLAMHNGRDRCFIYNGSGDLLTEWNVPQHKGMLSDVRFSRDGRYVFTGGGGGSLDAEGIVQWNISEGEAVRTLFSGFEYKISHLAISPDNRMLAAGGSERKIILFDLEADHGLPLSVQRWDSPATAIAGNPTGREATGLADGQILISDFPICHEPYRLVRGNGVEVLFLRCDQTGSRLVSVNKENMITLWNLDSRMQLAEVSSGHDGPIAGLEFSRTGRFVATCGNDGTIILLSGINLEIICRIIPEDPYSRMIDGKQLPVSSIAFDPEEKTLVSGGLDNMLRFWDVQSGRLIRPLMYGGIGSTDVGIKDLAFDTEGKRMLWSCGLHTYLLPIPIDQQGHLLASSVFRDTQAISPQQARIQEHTDPVMSIAFSTDSHSYASVGGGKLLLCDSEEEEPIGRLTCSHNFKSLAYSADGKSLRCLADNGTVLRMEISAASWIEHARRKANRRLTEEERTRFGQ